MSYRGPQPLRHYAETQAAMLRHAGQTGIWRQFISAVTGTPDAGLGDTRYYREQAITGLFGGGTLGSFGPQMQRQTRGGQIIAGGYRVSTREKLGPEDELIWQGVTYRVDSDRAPVRLNTLWMTELVRGDDA